MVEGLVPDVPFDKYHAEAQVDEYLGWPAMLDEMLAELSDDSADPTYYRRAPARSSWLS